MATAPDLRWVRRTDGLHVEALEDSTLAYDTGTDEVHCLSTTATLVWDACAEPRTSTELAAATGLAPAEVAQAVAALAERGLLEDTSRPDGMTRRRFGIAAAGVIGAGLVWTIASPTPAMAASDGGPVDPPLDQYLAVANLTVSPASTGDGPTVNMSIRNLSTMSTWSVPFGAMIVTMTLSEPAGFDPSDPAGSGNQGGGMNETFISQSQNATVATFANVGGEEGAFTLAPGEVLVNNGEVIEFSWDGGVNPVPARTGTVTVTISYTLVGDPTPRTQTTSAPWAIG